MTKRYGLTDKQLLNIFAPIEITKKVSIPIVNIGNNIEQTLHKSISNDIEGKCSVEGYIKNNSIDIITYSNGLIDGANISFTVIINCLVCSPVEGQVIQCIAQNITKAGIRAIVKKDNNGHSPIIIFIARDHYHKNSYFNKIKVDDDIRVTVIGQRFELNDQSISVIASLKIPDEEKANIRKEKIQEEIQERKRNKSKKNKAFIIEESDEETLEEDKPEEEVEDKPEEVEDKLEEVADETVADETVADETVADETVDETVDEEAYKEVEKVPDVKTDKVVIEEIDESPSPTSDELKEKERKQQKIFEEEIQQEEIKQKQIYDKTYKTQDIYDDLPPLLDNSDVSDDDDGN